ncbi:MAG: HD domain-containing protein [Lachnospiraceae bacterium]|nr:HD domain-containing protein [Lachnospiraceae bacterium]MBR1522825.1 HD domain-containing protein [Lachnospiraceae bacterium]
MKDKGWFSDNINKNRRIYAIVFTALTAMLLGLLVYYHNMGNRTFVVKGTQEGTESSDIHIQYERSKEWSEHGTPGFDKGMEYDFSLSDSGSGDIYEWQAEIIFTSDYVIDSSWNGTFEKADHKLIVRPDEQTEKVAAGETKTFGLVMISLDEQSVGEYRLYYKEDFTVTDMPVFWVLIAAILITLAVFITDEWNHRRYSRLRERQEEIQAILLESFTTFANIIDAKDPYTQGHSLRVAEYARLIAGKMGYSEAEQERVYWIGMLHDIGKIGITDAILQKPGQLDNTEYSTIQTHVDIGGLILKDFKALTDIADGAQYHHERWDGKGYSKHLEGKDIPEIARIICIADSFDAMTSPRVYRKALPVDFAKEELTKCAGTQFDPDIVPVMLELIDEGVVPVEIEV